MPYVVVMQCQFFFRKENRNFDPTKEYYITVDLDESCTLQELLDGAYEAGMSQGSHRSGCYEIQTDLGIWSQVNGKKIDPSKPQLTPFKTWEQLEAEE